MTFRYLDKDGAISFWTNIKNFVLSKIPTKTSELTNDSGFLTQHQSLSNYVTLNSSQTISGAKTFSSTITGDLTGTASKATGDANGREISTGYMWRGSYERIVGTNEEHKDLNTYQNAGFYNVKTALVDNCPSGIGVDAVLLVYPWDHGNYPTQEITEAAASSNARRWIRKCNNGTWSDWKRIAFTTDDISGNASTATQFSANKDVTLTGDVTGTASSKAGWSVSTTLSNSGVTAGTYGPSADVTGSNNATISVPEITVDAKGRVTAVTNRTYKSVNTDSDKKVYQYYKSDDNVYRLLFSNNSGNTATSNVGAVYSGLNNSFYVNPSTGSLYATKLYSGGTEVKVTDYDSHIADTDIHVTTADKTKWNNGVSQAYVFRYSSTALVASSTNSNALLDNTDNLKVGDKVIDSSGVLFSITAIDTANSTFTVGSALIDLAKDSDVVHTSGNETVGGIKTFSNNTYITSLNFTNEVESQSSSSSAVFPIVTTVTYTDQSPSQTARLNFRITANGDKSLYPHENNQYSLGVTSRRWTTLYGYFASLGGTYLGNEISANERTNLYLLANRDTDGQSGAYIGRFRQNRAQGAMSDGDVSFVGFDFLENSIRYTRCFTMGLTDWDSDGVPQTYYLTAHSSKGSLGTSSQKWKLINGLEPSALSFPDLNNGVDISGYITHLDKVVNSYTPSVSGWISIRVKKTSLAHASLMIYQTGCLLSSCETTEFGISGANLPVIANQKVEIYIYADALVEAKFFPCLGNV